MLSSGRGKSTEVLLHGAKKRGSNLGYKQDLSKVDDIWVNSIPLVLILFLVAFVSTMPTSVIIFPFPNILMQGNSHHEASNAKSPHLHWLCVSITQPSDLKPQSPDHKQPWHILAWRAQPPSSDWVDGDGLLWRSLFLPFFCCTSVFDQCEARREGGQRSGMWRKF